MALTVEQSLRQFCRLIFADRLFGDEVVAITLNKLSLSGEKNAPPHNLTTGLCAFFDLWSAAHARDAKPAFFSDDALFKSLGPPLPPDKVALLLKDILSVSNSEIADILQKPESEIENLIATGRATCANLSDGRVAIVEGEHDLAERYVALVENLGAEPLKPAQTQDQVHHLIETEKPDLIIADESSSARCAAERAVRESRDSHDCTVLLITDTPEHALNGNSDEPDVVVDNTCSYEAIQTVVAHCLSTERSRVTH